MKQKLLSLKKITDRKWINLFETVFLTSRKRKVTWTFASRKKNPIVDQTTDAVVIVPVIKNKEGEKEIVLIKEYRIATREEVWDFPAGLIEPDQTCHDAAEKELKEETGLTIKKVIKTSPAIYSSPGLTDESAIIVFVEAEGKITSENQERDEDIRVVSLNINELKSFINRNSIRWGAKAWTILYHYAQIGKIE